MAVLEGFTATRGAPVRLLAPQVEGEGGGEGGLGGIVYAPLALLRHWDHRILQRGLLNKLVLVFSTANFCAVL